MLFTLQDLNENSEKTSEEDEAFQETDWVDFTYGHHGKLQKKVNVKLNSLMATFNNKHHLTKKNFVSLIVC